MNVNLVSISWSKAENKMEQRVDVAQDRWRLGCSGRRAPSGQVWGVPVLTQAAPETHHKAWGKLGGP